MFLDPQVPFNKLPSIPSIHKGTRNYYQCLLNDVRATPALLDFKIIKFNCKYSTVMHQAAAHEICGEPSTEYSSVQRPWAETTGTLPKVPMPWHPSVLVIAVSDE